MFICSFKFLEVGVCVCVICIDYSINSCFECEIRFLFVDYILHGSGYVCYYVEIDFFQGFWFWGLLVMLYIWYLYPLS